MGSSIFKPRGTMFRSVSRFRGRFLVSRSYCSTNAGTDVVIDDAVTEKIIEATGSQYSIKLYEHLYELPKYGVGRQFVRSNWLLKKNYEEKQKPLSFWTVTHFKPERVTIYFWSSIIGVWVGPQT